MKTPVLYDGDMGGDDLWAIATLLAHRDRFDLLGVSSVYGNVSQPYAARNAANFLHWLGIDDLPVIEGVNIPYDGMHPFGDEAYGENGVGGIILPESPHPAQKVDVADWINTLLYAQPTKTMIFSTGPATNLALLLEKYPNSINKIDQIIFMGGALAPPGKDGKPTGRVGNITPHAEFNAYQDPKALNALIKHGAPLTFMATDATQNLVYTPARQKAFLQIDQSYAPAFHRMLMAVEELDKTKFGVDGPFIHDPHVITYALHPEWYQTSNRRLKLREEDPRGPAGDFRGAVIACEDGTPVRWVENLIDPEAVFQEIKNSIGRTISHANSSKGPARPAK